MKLTQPVKGKLAYAPDGVISQKFGENPQMYNTATFGYILGHNGIDWHGETGTPIYAAHSGKVVYAQEFQSVTGKAIKLLGEGIATIYCHCSELLVSAGQSVSAGQIIAKIGNSGSQYYYMAPHLHFGLYKVDGQGITINLDNGYRGAIDPLPFITQDIMEYIIVDKEQYLYDSTLNIALNIGDEIELAKLQKRGLSGPPAFHSDLPDNCLVYPLVEKIRLKDLLGL